MGKYGDKVCCKDDICCGRENCGCRAGVTFLSIFYTIILGLGVLAWINVPQLVTGIRSYFLTWLILIMILYTVVGAVMLIYYSIVQIMIKAKLGGETPDKMLPEKHRMQFRALGCGISRPKKGSHFTNYCPFIAVLILWILAFIVLLSPLFVLNEQVGLLNGRITDRVFGKSNPPNPFPSAYSLGAMILGGASEFGGYKSNFEIDHKTYKYKNGCKPNECEIDVFLPPGKTNVSVLYHIHGGNYVAGNKSDSLTAFGYWLEKGYGIVSIEYRFMDNKTISLYDIYQDGLEAYTFFKANGASWGLNTNRVVLFGESAGGGLAVLTAYRANDTAIKGVLNMYGITELEHYWNNSRGGFQDQYAIAAVLGNTAIQNFRSLSASTYVNPSTPPTVTIHGTWDTIVPYSESVYLHSVLEKNGVKNLLIPLATYQHSLDRHWYSPGGQITKFVLENFAATYLYP